jgi:hypothetical protein
MLRNTIKIDEHDQHTVSNYHLSQSRKNGYLGPCFMDFNRLIKLHMPITLLITEMIMTNIQINYSISKKRS